MTGQEIKVYAHEKAFLIIIGAAGKISKKIFV